MKKIAIFLTVLLFLSQINPAADAEKLRTNVNNANIRSGPELKAEIVLKAGKGDVFTIIGKEGDWYKILIPVETGSQASEGYIHSGLCDIIGPEEIPEQSVQQHPANRLARKSKTPPSAVRMDEKLFSGFFAKFGLMTTPAASFGDKWLLDFGKDWGINPFLAAGFELQPYFRSFSDSGFSDSTLGANIFVNAKGGVNLGRFVETLKFLSPYIGFGLGSAFAASSSKFGTEKVSSTNFYFAWHLMFGVEVVLKKMSAILEFQIIKIAVPEISPDLAQHFLMLGIRF
jgi:opacity protein-like surface antigen